MYKTPKTLSKQILICDTLNAIGIILAFVFFGWKLALVAFFLSFKVKPLF